MGDTWLNQTSPTIRNSIVAGTSSFDLVNTTATTVNACGAATTLNLGYTGTNDVTVNFMTGLTASGKTKAISIGTAGASGSTTNISIGSSTSGSVTNLSLNGLINGGLSTPPTISSLNGTWVGWNSAGLGESIFANFRQSGAGGFDFKIYALNASLVSTPLQIKASSVDVTVAALNFTNATSAAVSFGVGGAAAPTFTTRSAGTKAVYYQTLSGSSVDYGRGIAASTLWDSIPQAISGYSYKLYGGTTQILQVRGDGLMTLAADYNPSIKFKENGFTDTAGIYFNTAGTGDSNYLALTGSSSDLDPASQTIGLKVTQSGKVLAVQPTGGLGYGPGAGGGVTQLTSKTTAVTLNKVSGTITMNNASLSAGTTVIFTVNNSTVELGDTPIATSRGEYLVDYRAIAFGVVAGSFKISVTNLGATQSEAVIIDFNLFKGAGA